MGGACCCEEHETKAALVDVSQLPIVDYTEEQKPDSASVMMTDEQEDADPGIHETSKPVPGGLDEPIKPAPLAADPPVIEAVKAVPAPVVEEKLLAAGNFVVDVVSEGSKLGFGIGHKLGEPSIEVVKLHDVGMIPEWNREHPDKQVTIGCKIVAINGEPVVPGEREAMLKNITDAVQRPRLRLEIGQPAPQ
mmetsp:Transcript_43620/g.102858  ORF Transcript_43620/g.102858 Transcript_43620/m.102858 type:complete len:192 (+) Transcript_43620:109-684(+)|eukprot:CAMPEP_0178436774 /NCGR_PEP_ID=MMETSP0689_2-20121128/34618_1 /TAXON_ID=160604 /ORGANISM="Amphidinium massartii, Strain CS-259" /LENGTH=191 /DNA_ID=CAMNT_0020058891 /DNA_START=27 /DNA_END=602 /DNA_ORIENTATION=-